MTDKTLALLGDHEAAERVTERGELLPCWRCGGGAELEELKTGGKPIYAVVCVNCSCGAYGCAHKTKEEAISYWNHRAPVLTPAQLAALRLMEEPRVFEAGGHDKHTSDNL